jgi:hypothetical protein
MLYIVGGAARSGKTRLARRILEAASVPMFSLDALRVGLTKGAPALGLAFDHDDLEEGDRLWPIVSEMLEAILSSEARYLVEGSCLRPASVAALIRKRSGSDIRAVFLGFADADAHVKRSEIDLHHSGESDWFSRLPDAEKIAHVDRTIRDSRRLRDEARAAGIRYIDTGADFLQKQDDAFRFLTQDRV